MQNPELYYQSSGKASLQGILMAMLVGFPFSALFGIFYSWCLWKIPFIFLDVLLMIVFGLVLAVLSRGAIRRGKIRSVPVALVFCTLVTAIFIYAKWTEWSVQIGSEAAALPGSVYKAPGILSAFLHPEETWALMVVSTKIGVWSVSNFAVKGILLWLVWGAEAAVFFYFQVKTAIRQPQFPFSENAGMWVNGKICSEFVTATSSFEELCMRLEAGDFSQLLPENSPQMKYDRKWITMCYEDFSTGEYFLDVAEVVGKTRKPIAPLFGNKKSLGFLRIPREKYELLQEKLPGVWNPIK